MPKNSLDRLRYLVLLKDENTDPKGWRNDGFRASWDCKSHWSFPMKGKLKRKIDKINIDSNRELHRWATQLNLAPRFASGPSRPEEHTFVEYFVKMKGKPSSPTEDAQGAGGAIGSFASRRRLALPPSIPIHSWFKYSPSSDSSTDGFTKLPPNPNGSDEMSTLSPSVGGAFSPLPRPLPIPGLPPGSHSGVTTPLPYPPYEVAAPASPYPPPYAYPAKVFVSLDEGRLSADLSAEMRVASPIALPPHELAQIASIYQAMRTNAASPIPQLYLPPFSQSPSPVQWQVGANSGIWQQLHEWASTLDQLPLLQKEAVWSYCRNSPFSHLFQTPREASSPSPLTVSAATAFPLPSSRMTPSPLTLHPITSSLSASSLAGSSSPPTSICSSQSGPSSRSSSFSSASLDTSNDSFVTLIEHWRQASTLPGFPVGSAINVFCSAIRQLLAKSSPRPPTPMPPTDPSLMPNWAHPPPLEQRELLLHLYQQHQHQQQHHQQQQQQQQQQQLQQQLQQKSSPPLRKSQSQSPEAQGSGSEDERNAKRPKAMDVSSLVS